MSVCCCVVMAMLECVSQPVSCCRYSVSASQLKAWSLFGLSVFSSGPSAYGYLACLSIRLSLRPSVRPSVSQSVKESDSESVSQSVGRLIGRWVARSIGQSAHAHQKLICNFVNFAVVKTIQKPSITTKP